MCIRDQGEPGRRGPRQPAITSRAAQHQGVDEVDHGSAKPAKGRPAAQKASASTPLHSKPRNPEDHVGRAVLGAEAFGDARMPQMTPISRTPPGPARSRAGQPWVMVRPQRPTAKSTVSSSRKATPRLLVRIMGPLLPLSLIHISEPTRPY